MEGKTRLTWKVVKMTHRLWWEARVGPVALHVQTDYSWEAYGADVDTSNARGGTEPTLLAAQLAAEAAALTLLCEAVGAFGVEAPGAWVARPTIGEHAGNVHVRMPLAYPVSEMMTPSRATQLACALLAAAARGSK